MTNETTHSQPLITHHSARSSPIVPGSPLSFSSVFVPSLAAQSRISRGTASHSSSLYLRTSIYKSFWPSPVHPYLPSPTWSRPRSGIHSTVSRPRGAVPRRGHFHLSAPPCDKQTRMRIRQQEVESVRCQVG